MRKEVQRRTVYIQTDRGTVSIRATARFFKRYDPRGGDYNLTRLIKDLAADEPISLQALAQVYGCTVERLRQIYRCCVHPVTGVTLEERYVLVLKGKREKHISKFGIPDLIQIISGLSEKHNVMAQPKLIKSKPKYDTRTILLNDHECWVKYVLPARRLLGGTQDLFPLYLSEGILRQHDFVAALIDPSNVFLIPKVGVEKYRELFSRGITTAENTKKAFSIYLPDHEPSDRSSKMPFWRCRNYWDLLRDPCEVEKWLSESVPIWRATRRSRRDVVQT